MNGKKGKSKAHFRTSFLKEIGILRHFFIEKSLKIEEIVLRNIKRHLEEFSKNWKTHYKMKKLDV